MASHAARIGWVGVSLIGGYPELDSSGKQDLLISALAAQIDLLKERVPDDDCRNLLEALPARSLSATSEHVSYPDANIITVKLATADVRRTVRRIR